MSGFYTSTSPRTISELIAYELDPNFCRASGTFSASGAAVDLVIGTALAVVGGAPVLFNQDGLDGSEVLAGFCLTSVTVRDGQTANIVWIENGPARIVKNRIVWPSDIETGEITTALASLASDQFKFIEGQGTTN